MRLLYHVHTDPCDQFSSDEEAVISKSERTSAMNVWYGTKENADLSNLASRPFKDKNGREYVSVEHAYQTWKSGSFDKVTYDKYSKAGQKIIGKRGTKTAGNWNLQLMKRLIKQSFEQNPEAKARLLATGTTPFSHNQDTGVWKEAFPRLLAEVRAELVPF